MSEKKHYLFCWTSVVLQCSTNFTYFVTRTSVRLVDQTTSRSGGEDDRAERGYRRHRATPTTPRGSQMTDDRSPVGRYNPSPVKWSSEWSPVSTTRVDGWPVSITRQHGPCWRARVSTSRVDFVKLQVSACRQRRRQNVRFLLYKMRIYCYIYRPNSSCVCN